MAKKHGKRFLEVAKKIEKRKYEATEAFDILVSNCKKDDSVDVVYVLGINPKKSDQVIKGVVPNLPSGLGKSFSVAVFTKTKAEEAKKNGANFAGFEDLVEEVKAEKVKADVYVASKEIMPELAKLGLGRVLKGKMPNPKLGTVVEEKDLMKAVKEQKGGKLTFRSSGTLIQTSIGKASFTKEELFANLIELNKTILSSRPQAVKPHAYIKKVFASATMSPSIEIAENSIK